MQNRNWSDIYKIECQMAQSAMGKVYLALRKADNKKFALKVIEKTSSNERQMIINDSSLIAYLDSDELIKCVDLYYIERQVFIFTEYMENGPIKSIIQGTKQDTRRAYSEKFCKYTLYKVAKGLEKMHNRNVLHRDINSDNIMTSMDGSVKLADLGFSVTLSKLEAYRKKKRLTPNWVGPEIAQGVKYSKEVDVWEFGCFAYALATGDPPFSQVRRRNELLKHIINEEVPPIESTRWSPEF